VKGRDHLEDLDIDGRRIFKWRLWIGFIWLRIGCGAGFSAKHSNKPSDSVKGRETLEQLSDCQHVGDLIKLYQLMKLCADNAMRDWYF
jgi:hypothetical protein